MTDKPKAPPVQYDPPDVPDSQPGISPETGNSPRYIVTDSTSPKFACDVLDTKTGERSRFMSRLIAGDICSGLNEGSFPRFDWAWEPTPTAPEPPLEAKPCVCEAAGRCTAGGWEAEISEVPPPTSESDGLVHYPSGATRSADAEDVRYDLIPPSAMRRVAQRYALGAKTHGDRNWEKGQPAGSVVNHLLRHLHLWMGGDRSDDHLAAADWGLKCLMHHEEFHPELIEADFPRNLG